VNTRRCDHAKPARPHLSERNANDVQHEAVPEVDRLTGRGRDDTEHPVEVRGDPHVRTASSKDANWFLSERGAGTGRVKITP
jgi:hypothetical protein